MGKLAEILKGVKVPKEKQAAVAEADALLDRQFEQAKYIEHLEAEIKRLQKEKGISGVADGLTFSTHTGTYIEKGSNAHYCPKCLDQGKRRPLRTQDFGWRCSVCDAYYDNPDAPPPVIVSDYDPMDRI